MSFFGKILQGSLELALTKLPIKLYIFSTITLSLVFSAIDERMYIYMYMYVQCMYMYWQC